MIVGSRKRERQDVMAVEEPEHPLRAMGQAVEQEHGSTNEQLAGLREKMSRSIPAIKSQRYDATKFTEAHNKHKNLMNTRFLAPLTPSMRTLRICQDSWPSSMTSTSRGRYALPKR